MIKKIREIHEGLKDFKKQKNLRDFLTKDKYSDLTFVPYSGAEQLSPFTRKKSNQLGDDGDEDDDEINITADTDLTESDLNDTFETNDTNHVYYDHHSIASMSTVGLGSIGGSPRSPHAASKSVVSVGEGSQISTDGSLLLGQCTAPPGKLGIAIDTLNGQPVVHRVRDESPLAGVLRRLDVIVAIDDEDTSSMTAAEVTMLMAKKLGQKRKISFLRGKRAVEDLVEKV